MPDEQIEAPSASSPKPDTNVATPPEKNAAAAVKEQLNARPSTNASNDDDQETSLWSGGYSPKAMIGTWIFGGVLTLVALIAVGIYLSSYFLWALLAIVVLWAFAGAIYGYRRLGMFYELTTQRFIHQTGILSRRTDRIEVIDIDDVSVSQGLVERILGVGTVTIQSSDTSHPTLEMRGIANVKSVASLIDDIRRKERRRRSLHIEAI